MSSSHIHTSIYSDGLLSTPNRLVTIGFPNIASSIKPALPWQAILNAVFPSPDYLPMPFIPKAAFPNNGRRFILIAVFLNLDYLDTSFIP